MNKKSEFSKNRYKWMSSLIYISAFTGFCFVMYAIEVGKIQKEDKLFYFSTIVCILFFIDFLFAIITKEIPIGAGYGVVKKDNSPGLYLFRVILSIFLCFVGTLGVIFLK